MPTTVNSYLASTGSGSGDGSVSDPYLTLAEWLADIDKDLTGSDLVQILHVKDRVTHAGVVNLTGFNTDATRYAKIQGWEDNQHLGSPGSGAAIISSSGTICLYNDDGVHFENIEIRPAATTSTAVYCIEPKSYLTEYRKVTFMGNFLSHSSVEPTTEGHLFETCQLLGTGTNDMINGASSNSNNGYVILACCLVKNNFWARTYKTVVIENTIFLGTGAGWCQLNDTGTVGSGYHVRGAGDDTDAFTGGLAGLDTATDCLDEQDFTSHFNNSGSDDYTLLSGASAFIGEGYGTSEGSYIPSTDFAGNSLPSTDADIGPFQYVASGSSGTGEAAAQSSTTSGVGERTVTGSGAPSVQAAATTGSGVREIPGTGSLLAQSSEAAGVGEREIASTGSPAAQSATASGVGLRLVPGTGSLQAQASAATGAGLRLVSGSGTPESQSATVSGVAERIVTGTGAADSQNSTVAGSGASGGVSSGSGSAEAQSSVAAGAGEREIPGSGAAAAQGATVSGTGERVVVGLGTVAANDATSSGVGERVVTGTGSLESGASAAAGTDAATTISTYRSYEVSAEDREYTVAAEDREYTIAAEDREYTVAAEDREYTVRAA